MFSMNSLLSAIPLPAAAQAIAAPCGAAMKGKPAPVYARLLGGLGNQLFQYATGWAVAMRAGTELVLDARALKDGPFQYSFQHFAIEARIGSEEELPPSKAWPVRHTLWRIFGRPTTSPAIMLISG